MHVTKVGVVSIAMEHGRPYQHCSLERHLLDTHWNVQPGGVGCPMSTLHALKGSVSTDFGWLFYACVECV